MSKKRISCDEDIPNLIPFFKEPCRNNIRLQQTPQTKYVREQYCLEPAAAATVHKEQGATSDFGIVVDIPPTGILFALAYVALSRARHMDIDPETHKKNICTLHLLTKQHFHIPSHIKKAIEEEYDRLRTTLRQV